MPSHSETQHSPHSAEQIFDLVADIERYPEFLPWCRAARILERCENGCVAELVISFKHMTESYTSRVTWVRPGAIDVEMIKGPFAHLVNRWRFTPKEKGCEIGFFLDFAFRSRILEKLIGALFAKATDRMTEAFTQRADALYGKESAHEG